MDIKYPKAARTNIPNFELRGDRVPARFEIIEKITGRRFVVRKHMLLDRNLTM